MNAPNDFTIAGDHAEFRPAGPMSLEQEEQLVYAAIGHAREQKIDKLLIVLTGVTGYPLPTVVDRHRNVREAARAARGQVRLAIVVRPEMLEYEDFAVTIAAQEGLQLNVFSAEPEALAWLRNVK